MREEQNTKFGCGIYLTIVWQVFSYAKKTNKHKKLKGKSINNKLITYF